MVTIEGWRISAIATRIRFAELGCNEAMQLRGNMLSPNHECVMMTMEEDLNTGYRYESRV